MNVEIFRFATIHDSHIRDFKWWSRPYEYSFAMNQMGTKDKLKIHNTSWGSDNIKKWGQDACHDQQLFRMMLDCLGSVYHSDIELSEKFDTYQYDITKDETDFHEKFDYVINISTIEHLSHAVQFNVIMNLLKQVKMGGKLICTFDYPRVDVTHLESKLNKKLEIGNDILNGKNSIHPNMKYEKLNIVFLSISK